MDRLGPDAAYVTEAQMRGLSKRDLDHFLPFAPAFVIELLSKSDSVKEAQRKMRRWMENGVAVAWLVDPYRRTVTIYEAGGDAGIRTRLESGSKAIGTGPVEGLALELEEVWRSYELKGISEAVGSGLPQGLKRLRKKAGIWRKSLMQLPSGAEAPLI